MLLILVAINSTGLVINLVEFFITNPEHVKLLKKVYFLYLNIIIYNAFFQLFVVNCTESICHTTHITALLKLKVMLTESNNSLIT